MKPEELRQHKLDVINKIEKYLNDIKNEEDNGFFLNISDFMCRVGELESTLIWQFELARDKNAQPRKNRLCTCYEV